MKTLIVGDVVGRSGRDSVLEHLPKLIKQHEIDFTIVNGENSANGWGMTEKIAKQYFEVGADVLTAGDHVWDQDEMLKYINTEPRILRPANLPSQMPGKGWREYTLANGKKALVVHLMGQVFMGDNPDSPFEYWDKELAHYKLCANIDYILVDFHREATSEAYGFAHYLDGRVSAVVGTHTHVPTADAHVMANGTAYITDIGMSGDYDSVIGFEKSTSVKKFRTKNRKVKHTVSRGPATFCAVVIDINDNTGKAKSIQHIKLGGVLT